MRNTILLVLLAGQSLCAQGNVVWTTVRDTRENAFSVEVPHGWKAAGGMFRFRLINPRPSVDVTSPGGDINIRVGDSTIPNYVTPGLIHPPGPGVAAFASGDIFAIKYGQSRFAGMCQNVQVTKSGPLPSKYTKPGQGPTRVTAGAAGFTCTSKGQTMAGFVYAETMLVQGPMESNWYVTNLASVLAPATQGDAAGALLKHMGESIVFNPDWLRQEGERIRQATQFLQWTAKETWRQGEQDRARFQSQMDMMLKESAYANDVILGVSYTRDTWSGQVRQVQNGYSGKYWVNGKDQVVDSELSPGSRFHQLDVIQH